MKLSIDGYLNRVRSRRRLEVEAHRNIEVIWLAVAPPEAGPQTIAYSAGCITPPSGRCPGSLSFFADQLDLLGRELLAVEPHRPPLR
ncbi:hypothetical protein [Mesorhizobium sp. A556]